MSFRSYWDATKEVFQSFLKDQPFLLAAALSFYTLLSLAPLLLVVVGAAGMIFGEQAVRGELVTHIREFTGEEGAQVIQTILAEAAGPGRGVWSLTIGLITLLLGATTVFVQLQTALNQIWDVQPNPKGSAIWTMLRTRAASLGLILLIGLLLIAMLVASTVISAMQEQLEQWLPMPGWVPWVVDLLVSLALVTVLIAAVFKYLPDVKIAWGDVWFGAIVTGVLFGAGKFGIGLYLGQASVGSAYGAAGSLVVLLVWVYYSAILIFLGAEITQVYARRTGTAIEPADYAVRGEGEG